MLPLRKLMGSLLTVFWHAAFVPAPLLMAVLRRAEAASSSGGLIPIDDVEGPQYDGLRGSTHGLGRFTSGIFEMYKRRVDRQLAAQPGLLPHYSE